MIEEIKGEKERKKEEEIKKEKGNEWNGMKWEVN